MIRSLKLTRFKGFRETEVPLGGFALLVGTNASGKSNLRDALRFLHGCAQGFSLTEVLDEKWGQGGILQWRGLRGGVREAAYEGADSFAVEAELALPDHAGYGGARLRRDGGGSGRYSMTVALDGDRPRVRDEALSVDGRIGFDASPAAGDRNHVVVQLVGAGGSRHVRYSFLSSHSVLSQMADDEGPTKRLRQLAQQVRDLLRGMRFLELEPLAMREASLPGQQTLGDRGENLSSVLREIVGDERRKAALLGWLRALTPVDVRDLSFKEDFQGRTLVHLVEADGHETSAHSASDGTLRFLALTAALLGPGSDRFYFFEEIDNGFHPTRMHLLLDVLERASRERGYQIVATTHNPQLVAFLSQDARSDAVLLYRREHSRGSGAVRILDLPDIRRILESQDLGRLFATGWLEDAVEWSLDEASDPQAVLASA